MSDTLKARPLVVRPADFDVFRNDLLDIPEQACSGDIECATRDILHAIGEDVNREGLRDTPDAGGSRLCRTDRRLSRGSRAPDQRCHL